MKKILAVSLVAIMAAGAARADIASTTYVKNKISDLDVGAIGAENEVILSVSETDGKIGATTGKVTESHLNFDVATQAELDAVADAAAAAQTKADEIGTKNDQGKYTTGLGSRVESLEDEIATLSGGVGSVGTQIDNKINTLDVDVISKENEVILSVSETDGKISATTGKITEAHLNFEVATQGELDTVADAAAGAQSAAGSAQDAADAAQATANSAMTAIGGTDEQGNKTGLVADIAAAQSAAEAAQDAADAAQGTANSAMTAIGGTDAEGNKTGLVKEIADNADAAAAAKSAADAAQGAAEAAQGAADAAQGTASANATAIGTLSALTTDEKNSLVGAINEVDAHADAAATAAAGAKSAADAAQATADLKVNKSALGINDTAENPFEVPEWCKGEGVVCSFVVLDGTAGWQKVVDEDPADPAA